MAITVLAASRVARIPKAGVRFMLMVATFSLRTSTLLRLFMSCSAFINVMDEM
ncbi:unnamed protein product [Chondrus crispus]|uniref:Uncharacterized protein n=1 Tax=Chondrus crispus TaxID=2769 RepID=R7Q4Y1_CHOCR|nr:unnamed protein product [Chondrus crispus]CDF33069.1 unnamed protein product [Chondrus crispus]|eukprot:XP_005712872.1 unnamed protein product [Chondrus crispus]